MRSRHHHFLILFVLTMGGLGLSSVQSFAQDRLANSEVSEKVVKTRIEEVEAKRDLEDDVRQQLLESYRKTLEFIETERGNSVQADVFAQARESAPAEALSIREELEAAEAGSSEVTLDLEADASARGIEQRLQTERANQAAVSAKLAGLEQQLAAETNRPRVVRQILLAASQKSEELADALKLRTPPDELPLFTEAQRWSMSTEAVATNSEIRMLDQELLSQSARLDLMQAQRDMTGRNLKRIEARVLLLEDALVERRRSETEQIIAEADTSVFGKAGDHPAIRDLAKKIHELSERLQELTSGLERVEAASRLAVENLKVIQQSFQTSRQRLEIAGLSQALGVALHEQRRDLPNLRQYRRDAEKRTELIAEAGLRDIQLEAEWRELQDVPKYIAARLADAPDEDREAIEGPMEQLVAALRPLLKSTMAANSEYLRAMAQLDFQENQVQETATEFDSFLVERLLWVRSKKAAGLDTLLLLPREILDFLNPQPWLEALQVLLTPAAGMAPLVLAILIAGFLFWKNGALISDLRATAKSVGRPQEDSFTYTARAAGITVLLTLPWPLLTAMAGWELSQALDVSDGAKAIGHGLLRLTFALFFLRALKMICLEGGLAEAHFRWPASVTRSLRVQLDRLLLTFMLPAFVLTVAFWIRPDNFGGELGRIAFVIATAGLGAFLFRLLQPRNGLLNAIRQAQRYRSQMSWIWLVLGTTIPVIYAIAALAGYVYSATTLMSKLIDSLWLILSLLIAHELVSRWLLVVGGRLKLKVYLEEREAARAEHEQAKAAGGEDVAIPVEEPPVDVASIDADTRKLVNLVLLVLAFIGLGGIWSSVLPALSIFSDITLWEYLEGASGQQQLTPVTLADVLLAAAIGFVSIVATRTVPSLLEALLRHRSDITAGSRLAFATLARYSIVLIGVSLVASSIGFNWGKIQWLVAALGVGIGFGLQEIIANFISGLIILVERPIRVGDLVTVGDTSGTVTRLQIRATTVTNFDRQELLVPNKEFITGRVLNWSLSDEVIRLVIKVGVAYGSDMKRALALVKEAVETHKLVLKDPSPLITFDEFGDNSLNITARCFINSLSQRRETMSDLNLAVNQKFNEAGIVIAFPQRDVHLNTTSPLDVRIQHELPSE
jgi:potassium efflux system protein